MSTQGQRLGCRGYAELLRLVVDHGPLTVTELAERADLTRLNALRYLVTMHHAKVLRIAEWREKYHCPYRPAYALGSEPDAVMPTTRATARRATSARPAPLAVTHRSLSSHVLYFASVVKALAEPHSVDELQAAVGGNMSILRSLLRRMHSLHLIFIAEWYRAATNGVATRYWQFGIDKRNKSKPPKVDKVAYMRRYRAGLAARAETLQVLQALASNAGSFAAAEAA